MAGITRILDPYERRLEVEIETAYCRDVGFQVWETQYERRWFAKMRVFDKITKEMERANNYTEFYYEQLYERRELAQCLHTQNTEIMTEIFLIMTN